VLSLFKQLLELGDVDLDAFKRSQLTAVELDELLASANPYQLERRAHIRDGTATLGNGLDTLARQIAAYHKAAPHSAGLKDQTNASQLCRSRGSNRRSRNLSQPVVRESGGHFSNPAIGRNCRR
jgi:hypothetical protein